jgi:ATP-binding cassette subfamily B protein
VGASLILSGGIDFMTFFMFLLMVTRVYAPFDQSLALIAEVFVSDVSVARLNEIFDTHVTLFDDTVMENIRLGRRGATDEEVLAAAAAANCDEFVSHLSDGYATEIGENGARLSGGERQRISIARALLKDAPIVLLDEATASLDVENETKVQGALSRLLAGRTVLVIAHRMRTVMGADKIVVLDGGHVLEQGAPEELLERGGAFARMVSLQTKAAEWSL